VCGGDGRGGKPNRPQDEVSGHVLDLVLVGSENAVSDEVLERRRACLD
jgi:hypothetical protein